MLKKQFQHLGTQKGAANSWLAFQYGWYPLVSDLYGLQQQLREGFRQEGFLIKSTATSRDAWKAEDALSQGFSTVTSFTGTGFYLSRTVYFCRLSDTEVYAWNQMGLVNPALIAWEVVPFSFIIDWVIPIGALLESITATLGTSFVAGFEDRIAFGQFEAKGTYGQLVSGTPGSVRREVYAFERRVLSTFATPRLHWGNFLNTRRAVSALALLIQRK